MSLKVWKLESPKDVSLPEVSITIGTPTPGVIKFSELFDEGEIPWPLPAGIQWGVPIFGVRAKTDPRETLYLNVYKGDHKLKELGQAEGSSSGLVTILNIPDFRPWLDDREADLEIEFAYGGDVASLTSVRAPLRVIDDLENVRLLRGRLIG
ncbi:hypothetical protein [Pseudomonas sp. RIT-To-2]|uniref:hypothetical protein n=1 Tax=Pseudomonas sp. RIT-To-2 TaxID=3462541 RepID=UPI002413CC02